MSTNVYGPQDGPAPDFLRNTYDKQFQNLISTNFGELRPCFCKEVLPGDSVNIDPVVAIRSQPIIFPIQTRLKFYCHFFYGRNRILMKDWEDFIFKTKDGIIPPRLRLTPARASKMISTGSLGDNLGVPSTYSSDLPILSSFPFHPINNSIICALAINGYNFSQEISFSDVLTVFTFAKNNNLDIVQSYLNNSTEFSADKFIGFFSNPISSPLNDNFRTGSFLTSASDFPRSSKVFCCLLRNSSSENHYSFGSLPFEVSLNVVPSNDDGVYIEFSLSDSDKSALIAASENIISSGDTYSFFYGSYNSIKVGSHYLPDYSTPYFPQILTSSSLVSNTFVSSLIFSGTVDATGSSVIDFNKFVGAQPQIPLSALPFRLYEFICNYYYRNDTNNPYILNGEPQYNRFIPTTDSGWDDNEYLLHHRNWESDMFTTCVPSPQFGTAPLVGLTYNGGLTADVSTNVTDSDGVSRDLKIKVAVDDEGNISDILNADTGVPSGSLKQLMDAMSTTGISINTLRNVNSFQRFLENVIRRGLRYRNQLLSHFGVSVDYPDIDIPQFIGGFSGDLVVREVTNMAETSQVALGDVAGKIDAVIQSNHSINCYCAEHGFIMGIFCIVPVPTYSQVLPHMFTRYDAFDYFQKEFDKIGYVPVTYRNFLPLQADNPDEVFGYQRAWYEYMSSLDEVHGDFRLSLDDFVLYRVFKDKPTLNESFLKVDSDSLNNIFAVDKVEEKYKNSDKFLCQFYFMYSQKTMIPKHGVASLE